MKSIVNGQETVICYFFKDLISIGSVASSSAAPTEQSGEVSFALHL